MVMRSSSHNGGIGFLMTVMKLYALVVVVKLHGDGAKYWHSQVVVMEVGHWQWQWRF